MNIFKDHIDAKRVLREVYILSRLKHKNIIQIEDVYCDFRNSNGNLQYSVYLFSPLGVCDLQDLLKMKEPIDEYTVKYISSQILEALLYLKHMGILHRDIKPGNILIMKDLNVKLIDFGLSREVNSKTD